MEGYGSIFEATCEQPASFCFHISAFAFFQSGTVSARFLAVHLCGSLCFQGFLHQREPAPVHASVALGSWKFGQIMSESDVLSRGNFNPDSAAGRAFLDGVSG